MEVQNYILVFSIAILAFGTACPRPKCITRTRSLPPKNILNRNGKSLFSTAITLEVKIPDNLTEGCLIDTNETNEFIDLFKLNQQDETVVVFSFRCGGVHPIFLGEYKGKTFKTAFAYLQVRRCILGPHDVQQISQIANLMVMTMFETVLDPFKQPCKIFSKNATECYGLKSISSIGFSSPLNSSSSKILEFLNCTETFIATAELSLSQQGYEEFPQFIISKFPYLQTLELEMNNLALPPKFPWNDIVMNLGYNLSRSPYFDNHYTSQYYVKVPSNTFRRYLNLNFNKIIDLRSFQFKGKLDMISVTNNGLRYISDYTFSGLTGLQSLDLSDNFLNNIPLKTFQGLTDLRNLNLRNNTVKYLEKDTLKDLKNLIRLDFSFNDLEYLPRYIFSKLEKLKTLHLESNRLSYIPTEAFPLSSLHLEKVHLQYNPISVFPVVVLYLRFLTLADLRFSDINLDNISAVLQNVSYNYLAESVVESASTNNVNLDRRNSETKLRRIDMTGSKVTRIGYDVDENHKLLEIILRNFELVLDKTDILCDCRIITLSRWVQSKIKEGTFTLNEYFISNWKCQRPHELSGRPLLGVEEEDTYCEVKIELCPVKCICYKWSVSNITIVDCRNKSLTEVPKQLPKGTLDLWFQHNNITEVSEMEYFGRSRDVLFSHNSINQMTNSLIDSLGKNLRKLYLDSNYLGNFPTSIQSLSNIEIQMMNNPFICDCNTLWMKSWILTHQHIISDWSDVTCTYGEGEGHQFIAVEDDKFVCLEGFDTIKHVVAPSLTSSISILLFILAMGAGFIFRLEIKVLLFVYFGFHPFDKDEKGENEDLDCVVIHSKLLTNWVLDNIVAPLEAKENRYIVCEISRDFVVGFSYQENIVSFVRRSKRMILILSEEFLVDSDLVKIAWNEAQEKIKDMRTSYAIVICHEITPRMIDNKDLKRYIKRGRCINTNDNLFIEKVLYHMPQNDKQHFGRLPDLRKIVLETYECAENTDTEEVHAFLTYSDKDVYMALKTLTPVLHELNYVLHVPDRDFVPGASKEENILKAIGICRHTIFLLSGPFLEDEWALFTFRSASEKSIRQKCNHLIVIVIDDHENAFMDEEIKYYLKTHVVLNLKDQWFWEKLAKALPNANNENKEILNNRINDHIYRQHSINSRHGDGDPDRFAANGANGVEMHNENEIRFNKHDYRPETLVTKC